MVAVEVEHISTIVAAAIPVHVKCLVLVVCHRLVILARGML